MRRGVERAAFAGQRRAEPGGDLGQLLACDVPGVAGEQFGAGGAVAEVVVGAAVRDGPGAAQFLGEFAVRHRGADVADPQPVRIDRHREAGVVLRAPVQGEADGADDLLGRRVRHREPHRLRDPGVEGDGGVAVDVQLRSGEDVLALLAEEGAGQHVAPGRHPEGDGAAVVVREVRFLPGEFAHALEEGEVVAEGPSVAVQVFDGEVVPVAVLGVGAVQGRLGGVGGRPGDLEQSGVQLAGGEGGRGVGGNDVTAAGGADGAQRHVLATGCRARAGDPACCVQQHPFAGG